MPAAVAVDRSGRIVVGEAARNQYFIDPARGSVRMRSLLGTRQRVELLGQMFSPVELHATLLSQLRDNAEQALRMAVRAATIAVPCDFTTEQQLAVHAAAQLAGLQDVVLVHEPVAIAHAYGLTPQALPAHGQVLVCDLGARTCEATVLVADPTLVKVQQARRAPVPLGAMVPPVVMAQLDAMPTTSSHLHSPYLQSFGWSIRASAAQPGGSELCDQRLVAHLQQLCERDLGMSPHNSRRTMVRLKLAAEWVQTMLCTREVTSLRIPALVQVDNTERDLEAEISREQLDLLVEDDLRRSLGVLQIVQQQAAASAPGAMHLHAALLSGGGAELPIVRRLVHLLLSIEPQGTVPPSEAIARGCALLGVA